MRSQHAKFVGLSGVFSGYRKDPRAFDALALDDETPTIQRVIEIVVLLTPEYEIKKTFVAGLGMAPRMLAFEDVPLSDRFPFFGDGLDGGLERVAASVGDGNRICGNVHLSRLAPRLTISCWQPSASVQEPERDEPSLASASSRTPRTLVAAGIPASGTSVSWDPFRTAVAAD
jgi:hypothetical protein